MSLRHVVYVICAAAWLASIDFAAGFPTQLVRFNLKFNNPGQPVEIDGSPQSQETGPTRNFVSRPKEKDFAVNSLSRSTLEGTSAESLWPSTDSDVSTDSSQLSLGQDHPFEYEEQSDTGRKPIFAIAHRVLTIQGMKDAVAHGANALEIDMRGWSSWGRQGWYCDHDGTVTSPGDKAEDMFRAIEDQRRNGKTINFVWLDLKKPDEYSAGENAIEGLRDLSRIYLQGSGVRVLYGFSRSHMNGRAFGVIRDTLNSLEAVSINDKAANVHNAFQRRGTTIKNEKRVADYGYFWLGFEFGDCSESDYYTCTELRKAGRMRDEGKLGKVFGWTLAADQANLANALLGTARVDGLIYGFKASAYKDHKDTRAPLKDIQNWVQRNNETHYLAGQNDSPW
ncbi:hypothetical protein CNMCM7691_009211 [Aspergillus felis]|uniref:Phospholipase D n=1 Tax=Aspergillus felis TaxID=1287682 RepID=A0A8H6QUT9_9EURO|nr:hypothetical protein CNMCM7691_009211 [Aspergillus felis]